MSAFPAPTRKVYRVRNLPSHHDRHAVAQLLARCIGDMDDSTPKLNSVRVNVHSVAKSADPWEHVATQTATVSFSHHLDLKAGVKRDSGQEWRIPVAGLRGALILDTHFDGFTPLNDPDQYGHDCIAISGLGSHPFGSWQPRDDDRSFMWIRDVLPSCLPSVRFLIYGYDTTLRDSTSFQTIADLAGRFILDMKSYGWASPTAKPVVFLAHSLGGVLLKQVMVMLANSGEAESSILGRIGGAVFFGVPSKGMEVSQLLAMTKDQPNHALVSDLSVGSPYLVNLGMQFEGIAELRRMKIFWAYETKQSPTVARNPVDGSFSRSGPPVVLVSKDSATNGLYRTQPLSTFQIDDNHSGMVKFPQGDTRTSIVAQNLQDLVNRPDSHLPLKRSQVNRNIAALSDLKATGLLNDSVPPKTLSMVRTIVQDMFSTDVTLRSLRAPERDRRLEQIESVHSHTFGWVYDKRSVGFADWLRKGKGIFWISGKPGSGKSTLMKLIHSDPRTAQLMQTWGSRSRKITATFFFHHRGNVLQKSFEGLLRGIISQLVEQEPRLAEILQDMLVEDYFDRVENERLGSLPTDILDLFNRYGLKYEKEDDRETRQILSALNSRARLLDCFTSAGINGSHPRYAPLVETMLLQQLYLQDLQSSGSEEFCGSDTETDGLDYAIRRICEEELQIVHTQTLNVLVRQWLASVDLKTKMSRLLRRKQRPSMPEDVETAIEACINRQERRDSILLAVQNKEWTRQTLELALSQILQQDKPSVELTLFLDALDEYDGRPEFIAEFLTGVVQTRSSHTSVRVCFSSRPWGVFVDEFGTCPGFKIHKHTEDDIQTFCVDAMSGILGSCPELGELVPDIVRRAQGVFLWVRLVTRDLELAVRRPDNDSSQSTQLQELRRVLDSLPDQLSDYYLAIVQRIPLTSRWNTYVLLECVSRAHWELGLGVAHVALQVSRSSSFSLAKKQALSSSPYRHQQFTEEIHTISGGLVEVVRQSGPEDQRFFSASDVHSLEFMHQTVKEFVQDPEFKHRVLGNLASIALENGNSFLFKAYFLGGGAGEFTATAVAGYYARQTEITTGRSVYRFISEAPKSHFPARWTSASESLRQGQYWIKTPLLFAAFYGLNLYIRDSRAPGSAPRTATDADQESPFGGLIVALQENHHPVEQILETTKVLLDCDYRPTESDAINLAHPKYPFNSVLDSLIFSNCKALHDPGREQALSLLSMSSFNCPRLVTYLLERTPTGANGTDDRGYTPLDVLVQQTAMGLYRYEGDLHRCINVLRRHGALLRLTTGRVFRQFKYKVHRVSDRFQRELDEIMPFTSAIWMPGFEPKEFLSAISLTVTEVPNPLWEPLEQTQGSRRKGWGKLFRQKHPPS
ncbi:hypothetical protein QBC34DRAFT_100924 [Podospora aff. communis PSN243]|uniref:Nephrocystin 3-like N-terminal domain-containing protein n=1 Tax=Podospora aff. communis PSN243 TaxID=3040156 RepID=A0AAV9GL84_9PEZI|nr:hypothetical protein QBC34DRAFT_100924 [Podospora aff. communis PSN243]